ncbi:MAG: hypothetical protein IJ198_00350 [Lachnospiraceae bacterium]|nr:hypothetical protein [Lachnospiraceae bacterium]
MKRVYVMLLVAGLVLGQVKGVAAAEAAGGVVPETLQQAEEEAAKEAVPEETPEKTAPEEIPEETAAKEAVPEETPEETEPEEIPEETAPEKVPEETAPEEAVPEAAPEEARQEEMADTPAAKQEEAQVPSVTKQKAAAPKAAAKDVFIDNTVDNSKSYVTAVVKLSGTGGITKTIYTGDPIAVTYSNPRPDQVNQMIAVARDMAITYAQERKEKAKSGEYAVTVNVSTGKVWDNRKYTTVEDGDAVLIGDSDYITGGYGIPSGENENYTRTHIASGDYGKETFYRVEVIGFINAYEITSSATGSGTVTAVIDSDLTEENTALEGDKVTVTLKSGNGYLLRTYGIFCGDSQIEAAVFGSGTQEHTTTFTMPAGDVRISAEFVPHIHTLVHTDKAEADCVADGAEEYWTCTECGRLFADEEGTVEIDAPVTIPAKGHAWSEWKVIKEATETETGLRERICGNDPSHKETQDIPKIEIKEENKKEEKPAKTSTATKSSEKDSGHKKSSQKKSESAPTGDHSMPVLWGALMAFSVMAAAASVYLSRRKE